MKLIIAGSRDIKDETIVADTMHLLLESGLMDISDDLEIVSGGARGIDFQGEQWAARNYCDLKRFPADWDKYGKAAGPIRNTEMAEYADGLLAIWDGKSVGTKHMIETALKKGLKIWVVTV